MEEEEGGGMGLRKRLSEKGEVEYKSKAGTAWSHSYLNQKPWHPLSYPNQRRKWIAEQTDAQRLRRSQEVAREFAQEQDFFRQTSLISNKEKEKVEMMKAVSFMYVRPPGYNAESAKAAEIADERKKMDPSSASQGPTDGVHTAMPENVTVKEHSGEYKKKPRPKDVFGRALPTEEEFEVLKNAPRLETGLPARVKPFGVEVRNVKCVRCGTYGHQSGDRECPLKDAIMPNEESRLKRDDPLTAIMAHIETVEPLKWELKQKPGMSPPRGGFKPDDPNQQIVAEDIFDEYGGFLNGGNIPDLLTTFSANKPRKHSRSKSKHKHRSSTPGNDSNVHSKTRSLSPSDSNGDRERKRLKKKKKHTKKKRRHSDLSMSDISESDRYRRRSRHQHP
ncbi:zinc knuckle (CCHC-type) family protein [Tasmannia lanceolata]|uniref:zinc knuckle (CCHC-type) family protein n=1 Tax=Tasmannia lanceolata TaxID=3420 RepID=UPI004064C3DB